LDGGGEGGKICMDFPEAVAFFSICVIIGYYYRIEALRCFPGLHNDM
jgi:hypothetical protein